MAATEKKRSRSISFQFGIRTLACLCLIIALTFAWLSWRIRDAKVRWNRAAELRGKDWALLYDADKNGARYEIPEPSWSPEWIKNHLFSHVTNIQTGQDETLTSLDFLHQFPRLKHLDVGFSKNLEDLSGLVHVPELATLIVRSCPKVNNFDAIKSLKKLDFLSLKYNGFKVIVPGTFDGLEKLTHLETNCFNSKWNLDALSVLKNLESLDVQVSEEITNIDGLRSCKNLRKLNLYQCIALENLDGLAGLKELEEVYLANCESLKNIDGLADTTRVKQIALYSDQLHSIDGLKNISSLEDLRISCSQITNLDALQSLTQIETVVFENCEFKHGLQLCRYAGKLKRIVFRNCPGITDDREAVDERLFDFRSRHPEIEVVLEP